MARREQKRVPAGPMRRRAKSATVLTDARRHAGSGAIAQEKTPTESGWGWCSGGGWPPGAKPNQLEPQQPHQITSSHRWLSMAYEALTLPT